MPLPVLLDPPARPALGLAAAVAAVQSLARARFPESVDLTLRLGLDPKRSDHAVRGVAALPHGTGRTLRIAVFASGQAAADALAAGADLVGLDELVESVRAGGASAVDFDRCVATPAAMPRLGPIARILGPRGLMPNPKAGTLTADVGGAVAALRRGAAAFRSDRAGAVHMAVGRASFPGEHLAANVAAAVAAVAAARPAGAKAPRGGAFFRGATLSTTMGKGSVRLKLDARGTGLAAG